MSPHGSLTESSHTHSLSTPIGKGREGKGREVGNACMVSTGRGTTACDALASLAEVIA